jgi:hypothetical protein
MDWIDLDQDRTTGGLFLTRYWTFWLHKILGISWVAAQLAASQGELSSMKLVGNIGRAVAQAVSRWLPIAAARVRVRAAFGVCGGQSGTGSGFLRVFRLPCQSSFHQFLPHHNHPGLAQ